MIFWHLFAKSNFVGLNINSSSWQISERPKKYIKLLWRIEALMRYPSTILTYSSSAINSTAKIKTRLSQHHTTRGTLHIFLISTLLKWQNMNTAKSWMVCPSTTNSLAKTLRFYWKIKSNSLRSNWWQVKMSTNLNSSIIYGTCSQ